MRKYIESNGHVAWHLREHSLHADCYVNFITSVHCVFTMGQALHWAKHLTCFIISLNHMCCDYILCTSEETHRVEGSGPKARSVGLRSLNVKLLALLPPAFAIESIASTMDTDDLEGHLHKSFISVTHRHTHLEPAYFPFWLEVVSFFSIFF